MYKSSLVAFNMLLKCPTFHEMGLCAGRVGFGGFLDSLEDCASVREQLLAIKEGFTKEKI